MIEETGGDMNLTVTDLDQIEGLRLCADSYIQVLERNQYYYSAYFLKAVGNLEPDFLRVAPWYLNVAACVCFLRARGSDHNNAHLPVSPSAGLQQRSSRRSISLVSILSSKAKKRAKTSRARSARRLSCSVAELVATGQFARVAPQLAPTPLATASCAIDVRTSRRRRALYAKGTFAKHVSLLARVEQKSATRCSASAVRHLRRLSVHHSTSCC